MNIGRMDKRITIQENGEVETDFGIKRGWANKLTCWACVEPVSGKEQREALRVSNKIQYKVYIRFTKGITPEMRILYGDKIFEINSIIDFDERHETLNFICTEVI